MPKPLPIDGVRKAPLTVRLTKTQRAQMEKEARRSGASLARLVEVSMEWFLVEVPDSVRDELLAG